MAQHHSGTEPAKYDRQGVVNHGRYVMRHAACGFVGGRHAPEEYGQILGWLGRLYDESRANARVIDTIIVSLPRELDHEEQVRLLRSYLDLVTERRAPYLFVIHTDQPDNPHAHVIIRDSDVGTGRRVAGLSKIGSSQRLRALWEAMANVALRDHGVAISRHGKNSEEHRLLNQHVRQSQEERAPQRHQTPPAPTEAMTVHSSHVSVSQRGKQVSNVVQFPDPAASGPATVQYSLPDIQSVLRADAELTRLRGVKEQLRTLTTDHKSAQLQLDSVVKRMGDLAANVMKLTAAHASAEQTYADHRRWGSGLLRGFKVFGWKSPTRIRAERARDNYKVASDVLEHTSNRLERVRKEHRVLQQMAKKMERTESQIRMSDLSYGNDADLKDAEVILSSTLDMYAERVNEVDVLRSLANNDITSDEANRVRRVIAHQQARDGYSR